MHSKNYVCRKIKKLIIFNRDSKKQKIISVTGIMKCLRKNYFVSKKKTYTPFHYNNYHVEVPAAFRAVPPGSRSPGLCQTVKASPRGKFTG